MLNRYRNDVIKYGDDGRKNESVMVCFGRGGGKHPMQLPYRYTGCNLLG